MVWPRGIVGKACAQGKGNRVAVLERAEIETSSAQQFSSGPTYALCGNRDLSFSGPSPNPLVPALSGCCRPNFSSPVIALSTSL